MPPSPHMSHRTVPMKDNSEHRVKQLRGEDLYRKCCCDLSLEETMARVSGERATAFTSEELEKLVDGVLPQYTLLYHPPDKQVCTQGACCMAYACVERTGCKKEGGRVLRA
ncbi:hypothetical protein NDU88_003478 [Pleurodeles waltl]|uniref:Uncharacterized protein n=1 Tax=Pleurodeles waltl TaxID=8319 RepID=A0AAV7QD42_PLEWA|nr:hypothetical protein NDU88_003478 [Pleurodeles waltl]